VFYALYDEFGWARGLLMSVNIGWSISWEDPLDPVPSPYTSVTSKMFSIIHLTIGTMFLAMAMLYMARDLMENKDSWIVMSTKRDNIENKNKINLGDIVLFWQYYNSKLRVAKWSIAWIVFGCLWYSFGADYDNFFGVVDFLTSTLCSGGYLSLDINSNSLQFVVTAVFSLIGIPLFKITLGMLG
jgi:hypothetical protein